MMSIVEMSPTQLSRTEQSTKGADDRRIDGVVPPRSGTTLWIIIPTHNEAENLIRLIPKLQAEIVGRPCWILIVDDASADATKSIVEEFARAYGNVTLYRRPAKLGLGTALQDGLRRALADPHCELICTLDADLSHDPAQLQMLLAASDRAAFVQGSRYVPGGRILNWPWHRRLMSWAANRFCRLSGSRLREHTTNYRVYSRKAAEQAINTGAAGGFEWIVSASLAIQRAGLPAIEVPITFRDRETGESKLTPAAGLRYSLFFFQVLTARLAACLVRMFRFAVVGGTGVVVNQGLLMLLHGGYTPLALASLAAIEASLLWNFLFNHLWTWGDRAISWRVAFRRVHMAYALGAIVNFAVVMVAALMVPTLPPTHANLAGVAFAAITNFLLSTRWVWALSQS